jgi:predicted transcriptional regulator
MVRDTKLTLYVEDETKTELQARADQADQSLSAYLRTALHRDLQREAQDELASEIRAEERIQELITSGIERMERTADQIADMNAKMGVYSVANFELLKQDYKDATRRDALSTGARRLRQDLDVPLDDLEIENEHESDDREQNESIFDDLRSE